MDAKFDPLSVLLPQAGATPAATPDPASQAKPDFDPLAVMLPNGAASTAHVAASPPQAGLGHIAKLEGQGLVQGLASNAASENYVMDPQVLADAKNPALHAALEAGPFNLLSKILPSGEAINSGLAKLGLTSEQPQNSAEGLGAATARGVGAALPAAIGAPETLLSGALGGSAGEAAKQLGAPGWAQTLAAIAPGLVVGNVANAAKSAAKADATLAEFNDAKNALTGQKGSADAAISASAKARDDALTLAQQDHDAKMALVASTQKAVGTTAGTTQTLQDAGTAVQDWARKWLGNTLPAKLDSAWKPVNAAIGDTESTSLNGFKAALDSISGKAGMLAPIADVFKSRLAPQLSKALEKVEDESNPFGVADISAPWRDVKALRSTLGDALANPMTVKDIGQQNLSHLYASLTQDMASTAKRLGVGAAFDAANDASHKLYDLASGPIANIVSGKRPSLQFDPDPENVAHALLSQGNKGATQLNALRAEGAPLNELVSGSHGEGALGDTWGKLRPAAKAAILPDQTARGLLDSANAESIAAPAKLKATQDLANATHDANVAAAKQTSKLDAAGAKERLANAAEALKAQAGPNQLTALLKQIRNQVGIGALGAEAGTLLEPAMNGITQLLGMDHSIPLHTAATIGALGANVLAPAAKATAKRLPTAGVLNPLIAGEAGAKQAPTNR